MTTLPDSASEGQPACWRSEVPRSPRRLRRDRRDPLATLDRAFRRLSRAADHSSSVASAAVLGRPAARAGGEPRLMARLRTGLSAGR